MQQSSFCRTKILLFTLLVCCSLRAHDASRVSEGPEEGATVYLPEACLQQQANRAFYVSNSDDLEQWRELHAELGTRAALHRKEQMVRELVHAGVGHLEDEAVGLERALYDITHGAQFLYAELYLFVYDASGTCLAHGSCPDLIFDNRRDIVDAHGNAYVRHFLNLAHAGGGWTDYMWRNSLKRSYVAPAYVDGRMYIVGAGYHMHSAPEALESMVETAVDHFNHVVHARQMSPSDAFASMSYPAGRFVWGDWHLFAVDMERGILVAHGENPLLIGTNAWDYVDPQGIAVNVEIAQKLIDNPQRGVWQAYTSYASPKYAYARLVLDTEGNAYFIAAGYHPNADEHAAVQLVRQACAQIEDNGLEVTRQAIEDKKIHALRYGNLTTTIYDCDGTIVASGKNPRQAATDVSRLRDQDGHLQDHVAQELFVRVKAAAQHGTGWSALPSRGVLRSVYAEPVVVDAQEYIVSTDLVPFSVKAELELLVRLAIAELHTRPIPDALKRFRDVTSPFTRGDMQIYVISEDGIVLVWGDGRSMTWRDLSGLHDDEGRPLVQMILEETEQGPSHYCYSLGQVPCMGYAQTIELAGKRYIVGSAVCS